MKKHPISLIVAGLLVLAILGFFYYRHIRQPITISGAIVVQDADPRKQLPITGVQIRLLSGLTPGPVESDTSGFFSMRLFKKVQRGAPITLQFRHPNYRPLDLTQPAGNKLWVVRLVPLIRTVASTGRPAIPISNVRARYSTKARKSVNIGSAVRTFDVQNVGDVPCDHRSPCSPDGKWKAALGSISLDAGTGNEFENVRVSCIAGPCPFTAIDSDEFTRGGQKISVSVRDWSDTATFLLEAEVSHDMASQTEYQSFPVIFGTALSFTLPAQSEGVMLEADMAGQTIIFPLGPDLLLSWANCSVGTRRDQTKVYRCELKPGYRFQ